VSEKKAHVQPPWPKGCPRPGVPAWPDGAVRWLIDTVPACHWRHRALADQPWLLAAIGAIAVRAEVTALREQYQMTQHQWGPLLPQRQREQLIADTIREGRRLAGLLEQILAIEEALSQERGAIPGRPAVGPGRVRPAS
jgi:hypothetical protein